MVLYTEDGKRFFFLKKEEKEGRVGGWFSFHFLIFRLFYTHVYCSIS
jgi:hypothetical protein